MRDVSLGDLLLVLFVGLKLTGHIDWSWWLIFTPGFLQIVLATVIELEKRAKEQKKVRAVWLLRDKN